MTPAFDFTLPTSLIAQTPPPERGDSRMLVVQPGIGVVGESAFHRLPELLRSGDRLVLNDSRVLPARLAARRVDTGGKVEVLLLRPAEGESDGCYWYCMARPARRLRTGVKLLVARLDEPDAVLTVVRRTEDDEPGQVVVACPENLAEVAEKTGVMPLPPYIKRETEDLRDRERYQTVYATGDASGAGSVAAPTAGLHFTPEILAALAASGVGVSRVRLHVGPGTFQPPSPEQVASGRLHGEVFRMSATVSAELKATRAAGGRIIAVGTTALRVLESVRRLNLVEGGPSELVFGPTTDDPEPVFTGTARRLDGTWEICGETRLFISPPDGIAAADGLLTNFHLPGSSLLMLVASLVGESVWRPVYQYAVQNTMRFYSYGDCMLVLPTEAITGEGSGK